MKDSFGALLNEYDIDYNKSASCSYFCMLKSSSLTKQKKSQLPQQLELEIEDIRYYMLVKTLYCKYNIVNGQKELSYVLVLKQPKLKIMFAFRV